MVFLTLLMLLQGAMMKPELCAFVETRTPNEMMRLVQRFISFREEQNIAVWGKTDRTLSQGNIEDTVRILTIFEQYSPSGITIAAFVKNESKPAALIWELEKFISEAGTTGFSVLPCDTVIDIEIPEQKVW